MKDNKNINFILIFLCIVLRLFPYLKNNVYWNEADISKRVIYLQSWKEHSHEGKGMLFLL